MVVETAKQAFSRRLNEALDELPDCPRRGRAAWLSKAVSAAKRSKISQEAARKWLNKKSVPEDDNMAIVAHVAKVETAWLQHESGPKRIRPDDEQSTILKNIWEGLSHEERQAVIDFARFKAGDVEHRTRPTGRHGSARKR